MQKVGTTSVVVSNGGSLQAMLSSGKFSKSFNLYAFEVCVLNSGEALFLHMLANAEHLFSVLTCILLCDYTCAYFSPVLFSLCLFRLCFYIFICSVVVSDGHV